MPDPTVNLHVQVQADVKLTNGVVVGINAHNVCLTVPGPRGGAGTTIDIPLNQWDIVNDGVARVREALAAHKALVGGGRP